MNRRWKTAFDRIHAEEQLKEHTRAYLAQQLVRQQPRRRARWRPALATVCLLFVLALGSYWLFLIPTAFISIDLNPSLELSINRFDRVIAVQGYNDEGQMIADSLQLQYLDYRQALQELLNSQEIGSYLDQDAVLSMTVSGQDSSQCGSILQEVEGCAAAHQNIRCHSGDIEQVNQAHAAGMSLGKYQAFLILQQLDPSITEEQVRQLSMRQIRQLIDAYSERDGASGSEQGDAQAGQAGSHHSQEHGHQHRGWRPADD